MSDLLPRPSLGFATVSALTIGGNLLFLCLLIAAIIVEPNMFTIIGGLFVLPLNVLMAIQQYRGTFRSVPSAAKMMSVLCYFLAGFLFFAVVTTIGEAVSDATSLRLMASLLIPLLVASALIFAIGRTNATWSNKLRAAIIAMPSPHTRRSFFSLRELLLAVGVIGAMTGIISQFVRSTPPQYAENVDASSAPYRLPDGATNVSYCKGYRGTIAIEFSIDEQGFRDWVASGIGSIESQSDNIPLREITTPFTIIRCYFYSSELNGPDDITVSHGIYYSWSKEDRGVHAVYDRMTNRAYYHAHYH